MRHPPIPLGSRRAISALHRSPHVIRMVWHWLQINLHRTHVRSIAPQMSHDGGSGDGGAGRDATSFSSSAVGDGDCSVSDILFVRPGGGLCVRRESGRARPSASALPPNTSPSGHGPNGPVATRDTPDPTRPIGQASKRIFACPNYIGQAPTHSSAQAPCR